MKYPIGIQSFDQIIEGNWVYVDKTDLVYRLVTTTKTCFLSRPRRFGKSLLVSTLDAYFKGRKELFDGLMIAKLEKDWHQYPVFNIDFNGLNFTERGFGIRGALGVSDRGNTAVSKLKPGDIDWEHIFGELGVRWFHTGGIFAALSETTAEVVIEAVKTAKKYGTIVSYDLNYRPSLWKDNGGKETAQEVNKNIAKYVSVMIGNEEDFTACLGFEVEGNDANLKKLNIDGYCKMLSEVVKVYPNFKAIGTTLRTVKTATINDWSAMLYAVGSVHKGMSLPSLEIMDRVGGGDSFASGLIYGLMTTGDPDKAVNYGIAHGALAMTTPGDTSMASLKEVENIVSGAGARVQR